VKLLAGAWSRQRIGSLPAGRPFQLSAVAGLQVLASFAVQWYTVARLGVGAETDALYLGMTIPVVLIALLTQSLKSVLIPLLASDSEQEQSAQIWLLTVALTLIFGFLAYAAYLVAPWLVRLLAPGFTPETTDLATRLTRVQILSLIGCVIYPVLSAANNLRERFLWPPLAQLLSTIVGFGVLVWQLDRLGIVLAAWMQVLVNTLPALLLVPVLGRPRRAVWRPSLWRQLWVRMQPLVGIRALALSSVPLDRWLASMLPPGSIVILELVSRFYAAVLRVLTQGVLTPYFPSLSRLAAGRAWGEYRDLCRKQSIFIVGVASAMAGFVVVGAFGALLQIEGYSGHLVVGSLSVEQSERLITVAVFMAGYLPFAAFAESLSTAYYAQGDTNTPTTVAVVAFLVGLVLKVGGFLTAGVNGMAVAATLAAAGYALTLQYKLTRQATQARLAETG
jgi:putative peptidoglycan lipid II flippase